MNCQSDNYKQNLDECTENNNNNKNDNEQINKKDGAPSNSNIISSISLFSKNGRRKLSYKNVLSQMPIKPTNTNRLTSASALRNEHLSPRLISHNARRIRQGRRSQGAWKLRCPKDCFESEGGPSERRDSLCNGCNNKQRGPNRPRVLFSLEKS